MSDDPKLLSDIWRLKIQLNQGRFDRAWVDALVQTYSDRYDVYDAYGFALLWSALLTGNVYHAVLEIGYECGSDRDLSRNSAILSSLTHLAGSDGRHVRCQAEFWGGLSDSDGFFKWFDPMKLQSHVSHVASTPCRNDALLLARGELPLEVGLTSVGTSYAHIFSEGGLARWPYGSTRLYLFYAPAAPDTAIREEGASSA